MCVVFIIQLVSLVLVCKIALINCLRRFMQVRKVAIDTRIASAPIDVRPRHKPYLHKLRAKDPVELENKGYGPGKQ